MIPYSKQVISFVVIFFLIITNIPIARSQENYFILEGTIKGIKNGKVKLLYDPNIKGLNIDDSAKVINGAFEIRGNLANDHPYGTYLWLDDSIRTKLFFISAGRQAIQLHADHFFVSPKINTPAGNENARFMQEMKPVENSASIFFTDRHKIINEKYHGAPPATIIDSLKAALERISQAKDSVIKDFIYRNPDSYVGLWHLFDRLELLGYRPGLAEAYQWVHKDLRKSRLGTLTGNILHRSSKTAIGSFFPALSLQTTHGDTVLLYPDKGNKITLVDFWYSHCGPCIAQFDDLKSLYRKYHSKGFEIVSISTDKKSEIPLWHETISKYGLIWPQFLIPDQMEAIRLGINAFPYNFVVDKKGKIIYKRVTMLQLKNLLQEYL